MPSAVETLVKILRLEQETGYKNSAVIGGLEAYAPNWVLEARQQAKTDQQHALADELRNVMLKYSDSQDRLDRQRMIRYMLGRITGRTEPDPEFVGTVTDDHPSPEADDEVSHEPALPQETAGLPSNQDEDRGEDDEALPESDIITTSLEVDPVLQAAISAEASTPQVPKPHIAPREPLDLETALQTLGELEHPVETLHGIGKKRAEQLAKLGIVTINHLLFHFPLRYDDYTKMYPLHRLPADETVVAIGAVTDVTERVSRQNQPLIRVTLDDGSGKLVITFFNQPYLKRAIKPDMQILVYGKTSRYNGTMTMANPEWEPVDQKHLKRGQIVPVYPLTKGISSRVMRKLVHQVVDEWASRIPDYIPESVLARTEM
ncbi:MAG: hypothetical protein GYB66_02250, partial [Chloroflexi bacterium]|nr:hypothetical protein [Chloroflexota bacterium]